MRPDPTDIIIKKRLHRSRKKWTMAMYWQKF